MGPLLEDNFRQTMLMSESSMSIFYTNPIIWFFLVLMGFAIWAIVKTRKLNIMVS